MVKGCPTEFLSAVASRSNETGTRRGRPGNSELSSAFPPRAACGEGIDGPARMADGLCDGPGDRHKQRRRRRARGHDRAFNFARPPACSRSQAPTFRALENGWIPVPCYRRMSSYGVTGTARSAAMRTISFFRSAQWAPRETPARPRSGVFAFATRRQGNRARTIGDLRGKDTSPVASSAANAAKCAADQLGPLATTHRSGGASNTWAAFRPHYKCRTVILTRTFLGVIPMGAALLDSERAATSAWLLGALQLCCWLLVS